MKIDVTDIYKEALTKRLWFNDDMCDYLLVEENGDVVSSGKTPSQVFDKYMVQFINEKMQNERTD